MPLPIDVSTENGKIENFIGAPVPEFDVDSDRLCVRTYNFFKPAILDFFAIANDPHNPEYIGRLRILLQKFLQDPRYGILFLEKAAAKQLIPEGPFNEDWIQQWIDDLFPNEAVLEQYRLSVVIQGGEAVNFYTQYKYENVPTHDADTRVLAGKYFNYLIPLASMTTPEQQTAKEYMHKYRFFLAVGLETALKQFHIEARAQTAEAEAPGETYLAKWIDNYQNIQMNVFSTYMGHLYKNYIENNSYDQTNDYFIQYLLAIKVKIRNTQTNTTETCGIVDLFCPYKRPNNDPQEVRVGQADTIFSYFATEQASSILNPNAPPVAEGHVPSVNLGLNIPPGIPRVGDRNISIRLLPHGYTLFEQFRMLFVMDCLKRHEYSDKFKKYKQKINVMMSTLLNEDISKFIFDHCLTKRTKDAQLLPVLSGGNQLMVAPSQHKFEGESLPMKLNPIMDTMQETVSTKSQPMKIMVENDENINEVTPVRNQIKETSNEVTISKEEEADSSPLPLSPEELREARLYSQELAAKKLESVLQKKEFTLPDRKTLSNVQLAGYMDYLSYLYPEMSDFCRPLLPGEFEDMPPSPAAEHKRKQGGKAKKRMTHRKKHRHSVHTTYRK